MSSPANTREERQAFWNDHVLACQRSGRKKAHYCRDNNLTYHQFIYWASKHASHSAADDVVSEQRSSKLVPVMLAEPDYPTGLQLQLPNGVLISGISVHSVEMIGRLIEQL